jgi:predicted nuclease of predicted toxin-antitoxin system
VKLWIDEDLSPSLVEVCHEAGYQATSVRDRGKLSTKDYALAEIVLDEGWVLVTNNAGDFLKLAASADLHPGLVFIELGSAQQERDSLAVGIAHIEQRASTAEESTEQFMVNRVVEVDESGGCSDYEWP